MNTLIVVMAVPWEPARAKRAAALRRNLGAEVIWDEKHNAMDTFRRALAHIGTRPAILMEDDVRVVDDWDEQMTRVIEEHSEVVCQFFSLRDGNGERARGARFEPARTYIANLCVYLPQGYAASLLDYSFQYVREHPEHPTATDFVIRHWLMTRNEHYWMEAPSLVQHEAWQSSINARRPRNRQSNWVLGED